MEYVKRRSYGSFLLVDESRRMLTEIENSDTKNDQQRLNTSVYVIQLENLFSLLIILSEN